MAIGRRCRGRCGITAALPGASVVRRDVSRHRDIGCRERLRVPRMESGKQRPIQSMEEARHWERLFIGEIQAGRDPRRPRSRRKATDATPKDVAAFLDVYVERCVKPAGCAA